MSTSTDNRGRIYLPKEVRERFGEEYWIVGLPRHVVLIPVDEDPIAGILEAADGAFDDIGADEMRTRSRSTVSDMIQRRNTKRDEQE